MKPPMTRSQKSTILQAVCLIVALLVVLQLWLLTATMNAWLGGDASVVWPAAISSLICLLINFCLLRRLYALEPTQELRYQSEMSPLRSAKAGATFAERGDNGSLERHAKVVIWNPM